MSMEHVSKVECIEVLINRGRGVHLHVRACGVVRGQDWKAAVLARRAQPAAPPDGVLELDFLVEPDGAATARGLALDVDAECDINAGRLEHFWGDRRPLTGVRVYGKRGSQAVSLSSFFAQSA